MDDFEIVFASEIAQNPLEGARMACSFFFMSMAGIIWAAPWWKGGIRGTGRARTEEGGAGAAVGRAFVNGLFGIVGADGEEDGKVGGISS